MLRPFVSYLLLDQTHLVLPWPCAVHCSFAELPDLFDLGLLSYSPFFVSAFPFTLCPSSWLYFSRSYILGVCVDISQVFGVVLVEFLQCDTNSDLSGTMSSLLIKCLQSD